MKEDYFSSEHDALEKAYRTSYLVSRFLRKTLTAEEHDELDAWVAASEDNTRLFEELTDEKNIHATLAWYKKLNTEKALKKVKGNTEFIKPLGARSNRILYYSVAASILIAIGAYFIFRTSNDKPGSTIIVQKDADVLPGSDKATLTIEGRSPFALDTVNKNYLAQLGVAGSQGRISYDSSLSAVVEFHALQVPRKGKYQLVLSDGTRVWLNNASSIRYPNAFTQHQRRVEVTGEAYFEVAKDKTKPFIVVVNETEVEALGTAFNISAYTNEPAVLATLTEGKVKISQKGDEQILLPGQQAQISNGIIKVVPADIEETIAWKENKFVFKDTRVEPIMRQIERWYDVQIEYRDSISDHFNGQIARDEPLSGFLKILEGTGRIHFKLEGDKLIVMK